MTPEADSRDNAARPRAEFRRTDQLAWVGMMAAALTLAALLMLTRLVCR